MYYNPSGNPATGAEGLSSLMRAEFIAIGMAFDMVPQISTTGLFDTVFNQFGNYTFNLPAASGTLATTANIATETTRAMAAEGAEATARAAADTAETTRATAAEALLAPNASPALTGTPTGPTAAPGTNTTQFATTAYSTAAVAVETARATAAEGTNAAAISAETTRATAAEATKATPASLATAVAVETTRATAAEALLAPLGAVHGIGRNKLHNPLFNIAQRGSGPWTATATYTVDRWLTSLNLDTISVSQVALSDANRAAIGDEEAAYSLQIAFAGNAGANAYSAMIQRIENVRRLSNATVTVSFWAVAQSGTPKLGVDFAQTFGTGGSPSAAVVTPGAAVTLSTTWARYAVTQTVPSVAGKTLGTNNDHCTTAWLWFSSGTTNAVAAGSVGVQSNTVNLWGVQVEVGSAATPLEKPDPRYDLANCQRFYINEQTVITGYGATGAGAGQTHSFPVTMRATPTMGAVSNSNSNVTGFTLTALNSGQAVWVNGTVTATGAWSVNSAWTASADL